MEQSASVLYLTARLRRLRIYRLLANSYVPLLSVAVVVLVFRLIFPRLFSVLAFIWTADIFLLAVLVAPWLLVTWALSSGKLRCPSCNGPFAAKFHLWVPKACQCCGYDITAAPKSGVTSKSS
jgi:hypothetical protein